MLEILLENLPIIILMLVLIIIVPIMEHPKISFHLVNIGIILTIFLQTLMILSITVPQLSFFAQYSPPQSASWIIGDFLLCLFLALHVLNKKSILNSNSGELIGPIFLLMVISTIILLESENIFIISMAFLVLLNVVYYMSFTGDYKKDPKYFKEFKEMVGFTTFLLIILIAVLGLLLFSYNLINLKITFTSMQLIQEYLTYFAYFLALTLLPGFGVLVSRKIRRNFSDFPPLLIGIVSIVVFPTIFLVNFRIFTTFISFNHTLGYVFFGISLIGILWTIKELIYEFRKQTPQKRTNLTRIFFLLTSIDAQGFLLILSGYYFSAQAKTLFFSTTIWYFLVVIMFKVLILAVMLPYLRVLDKNYRLNTVSSKTWGWNFVLLILAPGIFLFDNAPGFQFISGLYSSLLNTATNLIPQSSDIIFLWIILILGFGIISFEFLIVVWFFNFIRKEITSKKNIEPVSPTSSLVFSDGFLVIFLYVLMVIWTIFGPKLDLISNLQTFFFF
ncbi:MAG: hypothetical protein ACTSWC_09175 [Promethearchaeota archaeon]